MDEMVELLAPAGDWDAFVAAVENGADAVYLGGKLFNARQFAGNFDNGQLEAAVEYAHVRDARVYLTMNTLMSGNELGQAMDFVSEAYRMGIDGIIVQDMGFAGMLRNEFPDLPLHASTQMTIYNLEGVRLLEKLGFSRVVLARELSLDEIARIAENTALEIETFIHGALCISYSGQCLMSSIIGGRSGNRGKCAQPCRLPYELIRHKMEAEDRDRENTVIVSRSGGENRIDNSAAKYLLSPKDMCSVYDLKGLMDAGVKSLKIEGRMKNPEYVATVVRIYRKYIDRIAEGGESKAIEEQDIKALTQIFNRGGLSRGYLGGKTGIDMMCYEKPKNWGIYLGEVISYDSDRKTVSVKLEEELSQGDGVEVWNGENESPGALISEMKVHNMSRTTAGKDETAVIGSLKGRIAKGNKIYKTSDKSLNLQARESYSGKSLRKVELTANISLNKGRSAILRVFDKSGNEVAVEGEKLPEDAINKPLTEERIREQMDKTGASPFKFSRIEIQLEEGLSLPISEINDIRRRALEEMEHKRSRNFVRKLPYISYETDEKISHFPGNSRNTSERIRIALHLSGIPGGYDFSGVRTDVVYLPYSAFLDGTPGDAVETLHRNGCEVFIWLPSITRGNYDRLIDDRLREIAKKDIDGILVGNPGLIERVKAHKGLKVMGDYTLNIFNFTAMKEMKQLGLEGCTLSPELNLGQIKSVGAVEGFAKEIIVYGRIPVMTSEYCPAGSIAGGHAGKRKCNGACRNGAYKLKDRMGMEFPIICDRIDCRCTILNSNVVFIPESMDKIRRSGVDMVRLNITDEGPEEASRIADMHREILDKGIQTAEKFKDEIQRIKDKGFTKGHFFRGV